MSKEKKIIWILFRIIIVVGAWITSGYTLYRFEYFKAFGDIDNIAGMIPIAMAIVFANGITVNLWMKHTKQFAPVSIMTTLFTVLSVLLFQTALRGNWWINVKTPGGEEATPDLSMYIPFSEGSKNAKLDEATTLKLIENLPILDGATALYPIYAAIAEAVYDKDSFSQDNVHHTNTLGAYELIISGRRDIIFVAGASKKQISAAKVAGVDLHFTPIGSEAFVFLVGIKNPVDNITFQQIRNIYSGKTAHWRTLGCNKGGRIIAFQRPEGSGSQTGLQNIMGNIPIQVPQPLPDASLIGTNSMMKQISVKWQGIQPAIGYSYRYFALTMYPNPDTKILKVNGIEPSMENIQNEIYPFIGKFYAVTNGKPKGNSKLLIDWILSPQGQEIIEKTGYIPIKMQTSHNRPVYVTPQ